MFRWIFHGLLVVAVCGCATAEKLEEEYFNFNRGVPVGWDSIPAAVQDSFKARYPGVVPSVERCDPGQTYRFELPSGEVLFLNSQGKEAVHGGVI